MEREEFEIQMVKMLLTFDGEKVAYGAWKGLGLLACLASFQYTCTSDEMSILMRA